MYIYYVYTSTNRYSLFKYIKNNDQTLPNKHMINILFVKRQHMFNIMSRTDENRALVMDTSRRNIEDTRYLVSEHTGGCCSTCLLNNHCHWESFVKNTKLAISLLVMQKIIIIIDYIYSSSAQFDSYSN